MGGGCDVAKPPFEPDLHRASGRSKRLQWVTMTTADQTLPAQWYANGLRFTCTQCGNCCTGPPGYVWFTEDELVAMAEHVGLSEDDFMNCYARKVRGRRTLNEVKTRYGYDCVFLSRTEEGQATCSLYSARPAQCRTWPFWPENLRTPSDWARAGRNCPGIDNGNGGAGRLYGIDQIRIQRDRTP